MITVEHSPTCPIAMYPQKICETCNGVVNLKGDNRCKDCNGTGVKNHCNCNFAEDMQLVLGR